MAEYLKHFVASQIAKCLEIRNSKAYEINCAARKMFFIISDCIIGSFGKALLHKSAEM